MLFARLRTILYLASDGGNTSVMLGGSGIFFTTKDTNDPKKFHGMNNAFPQSKPFPMKFFRVVLCFSLFKKHSTITSY